MSIERELLKRIANYGYYTISPHFIYEINELLAQPEQTEQEPVGIVRTIGGYPDDSEHVVDWLCKYKDLKEGDRLYTAPPKREPLSDETIAKLWGESYSGTTQMVRDFSRAIEKAHGIGGGE